MSQENVNDGFEPDLGYEINAEFETEPGFNDDKADKVSQVSQDREALDVSQLRITTLSNAVRDYTAPQYPAPNEPVKKEEKHETRLTSADVKGKLTSYLLFCLIMSVIGAAVQVGWSIGLYNTPIRAIRRFYATTYQERYGTPIPTKTSDLLWSVTQGLLPLGAMFGGLSSGLTADFFGRKYGLLFANVFVVAAGCLNIISKYIKSYESIMIARFITGIFCGLFTGILPLYLNELPPQNLRGLVGTFNQFGIVLGILLTNMCGLPNALGSDLRWPILVSLTLLLIIPHLFLIFGVESPKYLYVTRNEPEEAREVLMELRGRTQRNLVEHELSMLENEKINMANVKIVSWGELLGTPSYRFPLLIAIGVMICQQFSGINAVIFYSTKIFEDVGLKNNWPSLATILLGVVQLIMTLVCLFIIERAGRKILLLVGMIGMAISAFCLAIFRILGKDKDDNVLNSLTVVAAVAYIIFFSVGPGPIPWLLTSELFDSEARAKANSVSTFTNWFCAFIITVTFPFLEKAIGNYSFVLFGGLLVIFSIFVLIFVPETKNRSIDEAKLMLASQSVFLFEGSKKPEFAEF